MNMVRKRSTEDFMATHGDQIVEVEEMIGTRCTDLIEANPRQFTKPSKFL